MTVMAKKAPQERRPSMMGMPRAEDRAPVFQMHVYDVHVDLTLWQEFPAGSLSDEYIERCMCEAAATVRIETDCQIVGKKPRYERHGEELYALITYTQELHVAAKTTAEARAIGMERATDNCEKAGLLEYLVARKSTALDFDEF